MRRITDNWGRWFLWGVAALAVVVFLAGMGIIGFALVIVFREEWNPSDFVFTDYESVLTLVALYLVAMTLPFVVAVFVGVFVTWPFKFVVWRGLAAGIGMTDILFVVATIALLLAATASGDDYSGEDVAGDLVTLTEYVIIFSFIVSMMLAPGTFMAGFLGVLLGSRLRPRIVGRP